MSFDIILTIFLVALNGFFVAAEFAIVKVRSTQLAGLKNVPANIAGAARAVTTHLDSYLAATQLGITLASLGLGWVGEDVMTRLILKVMGWLNLSIAEKTAHNIAIPIAFAVITILHIVFGELAPKSFAIRKAVKTTIFVALPLRIFYFIFKPFIWVLNSFANMLLRVLGIPPAGEHEIHSEEELKLIITESEEGGAIEESERALLQNVFSFDESRVKKIMRQRKDIVALNASWPSEKFIEEALKEGYTRYPVYRDNIDEIIGIVNMKDIAQALGTQRAINVGAIIRPAVLVPESMKINDLLRKLQKEKRQMAIVTSEFGDTAGLLTMEDILEELVGEIQDEHDAEVPTVQEQPDGSFIVNAHALINNINPFLPEPFKQSEHYETLSGLIIDQSVQALAPGKKIRISNYEIEILKTYRNTVELVRLNYVG